jgi:hypothetical protein
MVLLTAQIRTRKELHGSEPCLFFIAVEPQTVFPDVGAYSGVGEPQHAQHAQLDAKSKSYREYAAGALPWHGLGLLDLLPGAHGHLGG